MRKNIALTLFSMLLMVISNIASASTCSYMASECMDDGKKGDEKVMHSSKYLGDSIRTLLTRVEDLLVKVDDHVKKDSSYWGDNDKDSDEHKKPSRDRKHGNSDKYNNSGEHEKSDKHEKAGNRLAYKHDQDDFDGFWMYGYGKKENHGFGGRHGNRGEHEFKRWWKHGMHKPHYDYDMPAVPVPAAAWLFGSGLIGLMAVARRKKFS